LHIFIRPSANIWSGQKKWKPKQFPLQRTYPSKKPFPVPFFLRRKPTKRLPTGKQRTEVVVLLRYIICLRQKNLVRYPGIEAETLISEPPFRRSASAQVNYCSPNLHFLPIPSAPS